MEEVLITTKDNPYSPFTRFDEWWNFDFMHEYNTCGLVGRLVITSSDLSDYDYDEAVDIAYAKAIKLSKSQMHEVVKKSDFDETGFRVIKN